MIQMELTLYQIDAFADRPFEGNPAAVCPLDEWLPDEIMQLIAEENNLSETAFYIPLGDESFQIRWFTPKTEVNLCGHATLAAAYVIFDIKGFKGKKIIFQSRSGKLEVRKRDSLFEMDFPSQTPMPCDIPKELEKALNIRPINYLKSEDYLIIFKTEEDLRNLKPNYELLKKLDLRGVIATARSEKYDFVLRFFAPKLGIKEDPVTGSAFTQLAPYWSKILEKQKMRAKQISKRGGEVFCEFRGERVIIAGKAVKYLEGKISINI